MAKRPPNDKKDALGERYLSGLPLRHYTPLTGQGMSSRLNIGMSIGLILIIGLVLLLIGNSIDSPQHDCENGAGDPLRRLEVCTALLEQPSASDDERARAYAARGNAHFRLGDFAAAVADYGQAIARDPDKPANWFNRGSAYYGAGRHRDAIRDFTEVIEINPDSGRAWYSRGYAHLRIGAAGQAVADFDQAIFFNPRLASAWSGRGMAQMAAGKYDRAVADLDEAIRIDPKFIPARISRATAIRLNGELQQAVTEFDHILALAPDNADAWIGRGDVHLERGDIERAIADYDGAIRLDRRRAGLWQGRGTAYLKKGDFGRALQDYDEALSLERDNAHWLNALAWLQATARESRLRDGAKAVTLAERAVRLDEANAFYRDTLAAAHAEAGHFIDAVREQERAVRMLRDGGEAKILADAQARLELYRQGRPYRE